MKIIAVSEDRLGLVLADKDIRLAIRHEDTETNTVTFMLGSMAVQLTKGEINSLLNYGVKG